MVAGDSSGPPTSVIADWRSRSPRAVLLDFNGTLSDDEHLLHEVFAELFAERYDGWRLTEDDYRRRLLGLSDREIVERIAHEHGDDDPQVVESVLAARSERYRTRTAEEPPVSHAAREFVRRVRADGALTGIVTGAERDEVEHVLSVCSLTDSFDVVVCAGDVSSGKPDPEGYQSAARMLGIEPDSCLVFEDSPVGVRAARAAGMPVIGVSGDGDPAALREADGAVTRLDPALLG